MDTKKIAKDIILTLKYNQHLSVDDQMVAVQLRLLEVIHTTEDKCMQISNEKKESAIQISDYSNILTPEMLKKIPAILN